MRKSLAIKMKEKPDKRLLIRRLLMRLMEEGDRNTEMRQDKVGEIGDDEGTVGKHVDDDDDEEEDDDDDDDDDDGNDDEMHDGKQEGRGQSGERPANDIEDIDDAASFEIGSAASAASGLILDQGTSQASNAAAIDDSEQSETQGGGGRGGAAEKPSAAPAVFSNAKDVTLGEHRQRSTQQKEIGGDHVVSDAVSIDGSLMSSVALDAAQMAMVGANVN